VNASLIPSWAKDAKISRHTYNARSETVAEKPSYRTAWRKRQFCLVLADNFYEPNYGTGKAVRWGIQTEDSNPFGIAGLWDKWTEPATGEVVVSFSMLTVNADAHPVMCQFHKTGDEKRTPVIIQPED
jgi:putative SOS response-associated peptidase YedK